LGWHRCAPESERGEELRRGDHTVEKASPTAEKGMLAPTEEEAATRK
jgi:hypothetical protein